jgi:hypothetical protein
MRPSGHNIMGGDVHRAREQAAVDAGVLHLCPKGPTARPGRAPKQLALL